MHCCFFVSINSPARSRLSLHLISPWLPLVLYGQRNWDVDSDREADWRWAKGAMEKKSFSCRCREQLDTTGESWRHFKPVRLGQREPLPRPAVGKDDARPAPLPPLTLCPARIPLWGRAFRKLSACLITKVWSWFVSSSNQRRHLQQILECWMGAWRSQHFWGLPHLETSNTAVRGLQRGKRWGLCLQGLIFNTRNINTFKNVLHKWLLPWSWKGAELHAS